MDSFVTRLPEIVMQLMAFALALSVHEAAHGWAAERMGDPTARWLGRITLNPIKHIDPFGTVVFPLLLAAIGAPVLGWAKPVPFVTRNLRNQRWGPAILAVAGPASNIALASIVTLLLLIAKAVVPGFRVLLISLLNAGAMGASGILAPLIYLLFSLAMINLVLAVFNMIPIPPLDGSHVLEAFLPPRASYTYAMLRPYGMFLLLALFWSGIFGHILDPFLRGLIWILLS